MSEKPHMVHVVGQLDLLQASQRGLYHSSHDLNGCGQRDNHNSGRIEAEIFTAFFERAQDCFYT